MKKIITLLLAVLMLFSFVGCGSQEDVVTEDGKRILKVEFLKAGYGTEFFEKVSKAFMVTHPDVQVKLIPNENVNGETETKLFSGKNISDIYYVSYWSAVRRWAVKGYVEDVTDLYSENVSEGQTLGDSILDYSKDLCRLSNKYWGIPNEASVNGLIYNSTMFKANEWSVPKTTKELKTFYDTVKNAGLTTTVEKKTFKVTPITYCGSGNDGYWNATLNTWWLQASGVEALNTFSKFESPDVFKDEGRLIALQNLKTFAYPSTSYLPDNIMSKDAITAQLDFLQGKAAIIPCGSWFETEMKGYISYYPDVEFKLMPTPVVSDQSTGASLAHDTDNYFMESSESCWFIPTGANNKADAKEYMKFLATAEASELWTKYTGGLRPFKYDTTVDSDLYKNASVFTKSIMDIWNTCKPYKVMSENPIAIAGYLGMWPQQTSPFVSMYSSGTSPQAYFDNDYKYVSHEWDTWQQMYNLK